MLDREKDKKHSEVKVNNDQEIVQVQTSLFLKIQVLNYEQIIIQRELTTMNRLRSYFPKMWQYSYSNLAKTKTYINVCIMPGMRTELYKEIKQNVS